MSDVACWCCGDTLTEVGLLRLGTRPEVSVCLGCVRFLRRRAQARRDEGHRTPASLVRGGIGRVRDAVVAHGWHERGAVGRLLRGLDRFLP